jgi:hypothetical protein
MIRAVSAQLMACALALLVNLRHVCPDNKEDLRVNQYASTCGDRLSSCSVWCMVESKTVEMSEDVDSYSAG